MKEINFKIIELPTHQILVSKDFDNDEDSSLLVVTFFDDGIKVNQSFWYKDEDVRDKAFNDFSDETATKFLNNALQMFKDE